MWWWYWILGGIGTGCCATACFLGWFYVVEILNRNEWIYQDPKCLPESQRKAMVFDCRTSAVWATLFNGPTFLYSVKIPNRAILLFYILYVRYYFKWKPISTRKYGKLYGLF